MVNVNWMIDDSRVDPDGHPGSPAVFSGRYHHRRARRRWSEGIHRWSRRHTLCVTDVVHIGGDAHMQPQREDYEDNEEEKAEATGGDAFGYDVNHVSEFYFVVSPDQ